jgi:osmotically-inducible protein OsmY
MSNQELENAVMTALADNPRVPVEEIAVEAIGDWIVLRGSVDGPVQHIEAMRTARAVPGVQRVDDMLHVRPLSYSGHIDADTEAAVLAALIDDDKLPTTGIEVDARGSTVTLTGYVVNESQRAHAEDVARQVGGVEHVYNQLGVTAPA